MWLRHQKSKPAAKVFVRTRSKRGGAVPLQILRAQLETTY